MYWPALKAKTYSVFAFAVKTSKFYDFLFFALVTSIIVIFLSCYVVKNVVFIAFFNDWSLLIHGHSFAVPQTFLTESSLTDTIIIILFFSFSTFHTAKFLLFYHVFLSLNKA